MIYNKCTRISKKIIQKIKKVEGKLCIMDLISDLSQEEERLCCSFDNVTCIGKRDLTSLE